jgi:hypothetical protein
MNPKVAVVVLVVIVLIFAVGVSTGALHSSNTTSGGWLETLQHAFVHPDPIDVTKTSGPCRQGNQLFIAAGSACTLQVSGGGSNVRRLHLTISSGQAHLIVKLKTNDPNKNLDGDDEFIAAQSSKDIDIYQQGAVITLGCSLGPTCRLS